MAWGQGAWKWHHQCEERFERSWLAEWEWAEKRHDDDVSPTVFCGGNWAAVGSGERKESTLLCPTWSESAENLNRGGRPSHKGV